MQATLSYVEEDGWTFERDGIPYTVYGTCEGDYTCHYEHGRMNMANGDPGYPDDWEIEQDSFDCWVDSVYKDDNEEVDITLTDAEMGHFENYMSDQLDSVAEEYDWND